MRSKTTHPKRYCREMRLAFCALMIAVLPNELKASSEDANHPVTEKVDAQWRGPGRAGIKAYVEKLGGRTDLAFPIAFYGDFTGDGQDDAIVFVYSYTGGSGINLDVVLFTGHRGSYRFRRRVQDVYGAEPRDAKFSKGMIEVTTTMPKPGDPHCCPTGSKRYHIRTD